ncbi:MAG: trimethylamine methyltransferase family protein [Dehalobacterium sp.]
MKVKSSFITSQEIKKIHDTTLTVLSEVGVKFQHQEALAVFSRFGARVENEIVYISEDIVNKALSTVPSSFILRGRDAKNDQLIGGLDPVFAPASGPVFINENNRRRPVTRDDYIDLIKLCETSPVIDVVNPNIVEPQDMPVDQRPMFQMRTCLKYSSKPLIGITTGLDTAKNCLNLLDQVYQNNNDYYLMGIISPISPLVYETTMVDSIFAYAEKNQPLMLASCSLPGGTSPVSLAGTLVIDNAQVLAGIVLVQLIKPGLPVIYANTSSSCDLRYVNPCIGSPETGLITIAAAELARFYNIPSRSGGGLTDAKAVDMQAGIESAMTILPALMSGVSFMLQSCGITDSFNSLSFEKFIIDEEIIRFAGRFVKGFEVSDDLLGLDVIKKVGPGGCFLGEHHTMEHFKKELFNTSLFAKEGYAQWQRQGAFSVNKKAKQEVQKRLSEYKLPSVLRYF